MPQKLSRKAFDAWLQSKVDDDVVGHRSNGSLCPLATYIQDNLGLPDAAVFNGYWYPDIHKYKLYPTPPWAAAFARYIDTGNFADTRTVIFPTSVVKAKEAKEALSHARLRVG